MAVETLADVASYIEHIRRKIVARAEACEPGALTWQPAPGRWSVLGHLEHVGLAEKIFVERARELAEQARAQGRLARPGAPRLVDARAAMMPLAGTRMDAPDTMLPEGRSLAEVKALLAQSRAGALQLLQELEELDTDQIRLVFRGIDLNVAQFMHVIGLHEIGHDRHMQANLEAWANRGAGL